MDILVKDHSARKILLFEDSCLDRLNKIEDLKYQDDRNGFWLDAEGIRLRYNLKAREGVRGIELWFPNGLSDGKRSWSDISFRGLNLMNLPNIGEKTCRCIGVHNFSIYPHLDPQTYWIYRDECFQSEQKGDETSFLKGDEALGLAVERMGFAEYLERFSSSKAIGR